MKTFFSRFWAPSLLAAIAVFLCIMNYVPGTYLSGWDTIHPEFNFPDYFKRMFSMWQEHQGLGAVAAQAHAAELPRVIIYYLYSFFIPESFLRYLYFFMCLIIGPLGVYYFTKEVLYQKLGHYAKEVVAFSSGMLYLLNLTTLQQFSVPLEMFATHYAFLGWTFLFAIKYLLKGNRTILFLFGLITFLSAPMAHTPTLFYSFFVVFCLFIITFWLVKRFPIRRVFIAIGVTLLLNCFWLLPNIYYVIFYGESVANSKIHYQFSDRAFQIGTNFGNIRDTALLRNFLFDWGQYDVSEGKFTYLLNVWNVHFQSIINAIIGLLIFFAVLFGLVAGVLKRNSLAIAFLPVFLIPYFFINNDNIFFRLLNDFLTQHVDLLKESLRFPYTKFSILLLFSYCVYFSFALASFISFISRIKFGTRTLKEFVIATIFGITISGLLIFFMLPAFSGNLISDNVKVKIPAEYFQMFEYFKTKGANERIAQFPVHTFWGWYYYDWGFEGAGFSWFGTQQPLLDREFDRWHPANENYYWEISYATYSQNLTLLENVLEKYRVSYLVIDTHVLDASSTKAPSLNKLDELIANSKRIHFDRKIGGIAIYTFDLNEKNSLISIDGNLPIVGPEYIKNNNDRAYTDLGEYVSVSKSNESTMDVFYPFRSLFSNRSPDQIEYDVEETDDALYFKKELPKNLENYDLIQPDFSTQQIVWYGQDDLDVSGSTVPTISIDGENLIVKVPKVKSYFSAEIDASKSEVVGAQKNCDYLGSKKESAQVIVENKVVSEGGKDFLQIKSVLANNCASQFLLDNLSHNTAYIISIENKNVANKSLLFWLENLNQKKVDIESYLPQNNQLNTSYFIQPPMEEFGRGYYLHFDNWSFNKAETVNNLGKISVYPLPYEYLTAISFKRKDFSKAEGINCDYTVQKYQPYYIEVQLQEGCENGKLLSLNESYDDGWMAFGRVGNFGLKSYEKVKTNNWANGFILPDNHSKSVLLFFVPQVLQFLGYLIFIVIFAMLTLRLFKRKKVES